MTNSLRVSTAELEITQFEAQKEKNKGEERPRLQWDAPRNIIIGMIHSM